MGQFTTPPKSDQVDENNAILYHQPAVRSHICMSENQNVFLSSDVMSHASDLRQCILEIGRMSRLDMY